MGMTTVRAAFIGASLVALSLGGALADDATTPANTTTPATQQTPQTSTATTTTPTQDQAQADKDKEVVCKKEDPPTGSHMGGRKVCHTVAEWRAMAQEGRDLVEGAQAAARADTPDGN